jgi:Flp pilus assembly protein TadG
MRLHRSDRAARRGTMAVEMAFMAPLLMFLAVIGVDYARIFSRALILESASRNGCWYACQDATHAADTAGIQAVALRDLTDVDPTPTVTSSTYTGADGYTYVKVTVTMTFSTITNYPGVPSSSSLARSTDMRVCPTTPKPGTY